MDIHQLNFSFLKKSMNSEAPIHRQIKVAILADSSTQLIVQALIGYGRMLGTRYTVFEPAPDQLDQQVFDLSSELYRFSPGIVLILLSTQKQQQDFYRLRADRRIDFADERSSYIDTLVKTLGQQLSVPVIIGNLPEIDDGVFGHYAGKTASSFLYQLRKLNYLLMEKASANPGVFICDLAALTAKMGFNNSFDPKMRTYADMAFHIDFLPWLVKAWHDIIQAINGQINKCLILDLDNTTWGGIIGDDGLEGIQIGTLGLGKIFTGIQLWVKQLAQRGIIVVICSKNEEETARSPFLHHPEMELRMEDIALFVANWENKVDNIRYIQQVLNIGFDTMVFLDDDPVERARIQQTIPEITVPDLPKDPAEWLSWLQDLDLFETAYLTPEDGARTAAYQKAIERTRLQKTFINESDFLASLEMRSEVKAIDAFTLPRAVQLSQRSNQFNLRTIRYTESDLQDITADPRYLTLSFTLEDKYGDYGLIALVVGHRQEDALWIDNWIMSCRVLKRGMENFVFECLCQAAANAGYKSLIGEFLPTKKNDLVKDHYERLEFSNVGGNRWARDLTDIPSSTQNLIKRK
jgi:FkbH-like protein